MAERMQLIATHSAQEYNQRKGRYGAFREDRYHATAIEADDHLLRCFVYIDLNMVRAGAVKHSAQSGNREIQKPPKRYAVIDLRISRVIDVRRLTTTRWAIPGHARLHTFQLIRRQFP